jgi:hypothetical protein
VAAGLVRVERMIWGRRPTGKSQMTPAVGAVSGLCAG